MRYNNEEQDSLVLGGPLELERVIKQLAAALFEEQPISLHELQLCRDYIRAIGEYPSFTEKIRDMHKFLLDSYWIDLTKSEPESYVKDAYNPDELIAPKR